MLCDSMIPALIPFLSKYLFILKAASEGWRVSYIGGNQYEFSNDITASVTLQSDTIDRFRVKYTNKF